MTETLLHLFPHQQKKKLRDLENELRIYKYMKLFILLLVLFFVGYSWEEFGITKLIFFLFGCSYGWFVQRGKEKHKELLRWRLMVNPSVDKGGD
ncbi:hypothetical protein [Prochlorococcus marinus]|uniref:hypothetical protein n=1 Tax=Prochlorococcus marinus TaxID=1219 RepID=UPI0007B39016|nr:hypothetical protein [Prochlorococcus marinus]KZR76723.1 hypothetical protein PMIT1320_00631 [Prochlorococcus marinus str. MIT 1320]